MELRNSFPPPDVIRNLIEESKFKVPTIFKGIHASWIPVAWDVKDFTGIFKCEDNEYLRCRVGKMQSKTSEPQWESETKVKSFSWNSLCTWNSTEEWIYFDYKNMADVVQDKFLPTFEWSIFGYPERQGTVCNLWAGTSGSYTPCHFDTYGCNLVAQVKGRKQWLMFPPEATPQLHPTRIPYEESSVYSKINFTNPSISIPSYLKKLNGVLVDLDPGDVLYVPPKWWHFVQSKDFSISVNTWIETAADVEMRVQEGIVRSVISAFVSMSSPDTTFKLLNPNEEELLDASEAQLEQFIGKSVQDLLPHMPKDRIIHQDQEESEVAVKKFKLTHPGCSNLFTPEVVSLLEKYGTVQIVKSLDTASCHDSQGQNRSDTSGTPLGVGDTNVSKSTYMFHLINAICHPNVLETIRKQLIENVLSSPPASLP